MRSIALFAVAIVVGGSYLAKYADHAVVPQPASNVVSDDQPAVTAQAGSGPRSIELASDRNGHFPVDADIDGQHVGFIVDTGASLVTLREYDAASLGI